MTDRSESYTAVVTTDSRRRVLLALTLHRSLLPAAVAPLLPTQIQVRETLTSLTDSGPTQPNAELLGSLGIDLDQVRAAVRRTFGPEAVQQLATRRVHQPWQPWRRPTRGCIPAQVACRRHLSGR